MLAIAALLVPCSTSAHPHHDDEEDEMKMHIARILREIGSPCATVVQVEETLSEYVVTCEIDRDGALSHAVYTVKKPG